MNDKSIDTNKKNKLLSKKYKQSMIIHIILVLFLACGLYFCCEVPTTEQTQNDDDWLYFTLS